MKKKLLGFLLVLCVALLMLCTTAMADVCQCIDTNGDCVCDTCRQPYHSDANTDHTCDNCGETVGVCADNNFDGTCDYGCGKTFTYVTITSSYEVCPQLDYNLTWNFNKGSAEEAEVKYVKLGRSLRFHPWGTQQVTFTSSQINDVLAQESVLDVEFMIDFSVNAVKASRTETYRLIGKHHDDNADDLCDSCGKHLVDCTDSDGDFRCDGCGEHVHHDEDQDHNCDWCGAAVSKHEDKDYNHLCDLYGAACGRQSSIAPHADSDGDHLCDYCGEDCHTDANKDHTCETCGETVGVCADNNFDGTCDYGCGKTFTYVTITSSYEVCPDSAYQLTWTLVSGNITAVDYNLDGQSDWDGTAGQLSVSQKQVGRMYRLESNKWAIRFILNNDYQEEFELSWGHTDGNSDHKCDYGCGKDFGVCADPDLDHKCDYGCGKDFGVCADPDLDHKCDYGCGKTFGTCADPDLDHKCDYGCGKTFGVCEDTDTDHKCDYGCGKAFGVCEDTDKDHLCDYGCGKVLSDHSYTAVVTKPTCTADGYTTYTCAICGDTYTADATRATGHWYGLWGADGQQAHTAYCKHDNCRHASETLCTRYEVTADASGSLLTVCPVCGEFGEVCFEELADAQITAIDRNALPRGAAIVRGLDKPFGNVLYAFTAVYEFAGEVQPFSSKVSVSLMLNVDLADFRLVRVDVTPATADSARTETWTELAFTFADGKLTFETEHEGLFLLLPMN